MTTKEKQVKYLIKRYYQIQKHRVAMENELYQLREEGEDPEVLNEFHDRFETIEKDIKKWLSQALEGHIMWDWLEDTKGIGPILAACLLTYINPEKAPHASSVWKYAGLAPGQERKKGQKLTFNPDLKKACWKVGESFVKGGDKYRKHYEQSREHYEKKFPEVKENEKGHKKYTKGHKYEMAKRRTVKRFLAEMWAEWRDRLDLPVTEPYAHRGDHPKNPKYKVVEE